MRKFTLIFTLLVAMVTTAMAQEVYVTNLNDLSNEKTYLIESARCILINSANVTTKLATTNGTSVGTVTRSIDDQNQQFKIEKDGENYYLFSVGANKYVAENGNWSDTKSAALTITDVSSTYIGYPWKLSLGSNYLNSQDPNQTPEGIMLNGWSTTDPGNCYRFVDIEATKAAQFIDVTYVYMLDGVEKHREIVKQAIGSAYALPVDIPYVAETITEGTVTEETTTIEVACELESTPFEAAASYGEIEKWYYMQIRDDGFTYLQYDNTKQYIPASQSSEPTSSKNTYAWAFVGDPFNGFQIVNRAAGETMVLSAPSTPTGNQNAAELARMVQKENASGNTTWVITPATHPNAVANTFYVQHPTATAYAFNRQDYVGAKTLCYWNNRDTGSALKVIECEISTLGDELATLVAQAEALLEQIEIGDGVGKYSSSYENYATVYAEIVDYSKNIPATATDEEIQEKITTLNAIINSFSLNMPEKGKYYRLYCKAGDLYLSSDISNNRLEMQGKNPTSASQVFLCVENGENLTLLSYAKGQAVNAYNLDEIGTMSMSTVKFSATYNGVLSQYNIKINDARYIYGQGNTQNNHIDSGAGNPNDNGYNWTIEEVTELPVTVSAAGYATLYAPVALTIPSSVKAYTAAINGEWATLTEVNGVIPANTGVVLKGEGNHSFAIAEDAQSIEGNALRGSVATTYYTEAGTYYALAMVDDVVGFYKDEFSNNRFQNNSHKAYLYVAPEAAANVACYSFRFDGTTGIENVEGQSEGTAIYDLMGRRVENPTRGIYVINGKKVLVK